MSYYKHKCKFKPKINSKYKTEIIAKKAKNEGTIKAKNKPKNMLEWKKKMNIVMH